jgi:hypothetical protein
MPAGENGLEFPAVQTYDNGDVVRWTGPEDADEPAARLAIYELGEFQEEGLGQLGVLDAVVTELDEMNAAAGEHSEAVDDEDDDSDTLPLALSGLGAGLGAIAVIIALRRKPA